MAFYDEHKGIKLKLPTFDACLAERGYPMIPAAPPNPFFKNCGELLNDTTRFVTEEEYAEANRRDGYGDTPARIVTEAHQNALSSGPVSYKQLTPATNIEVLLPVAAIL